jgi:hypothetical protein
MEITRQVSNEIAIQSLNDLELLEKRKGKYTLKQYSVK